MKATTVTLFAAAIAFAGMCRADAYVIPKTDRAIRKDGVMQIPASVTPLLRFPLFWLSLHNLPEGLYHWMVRRTLKHDGYLVTYFHPWEFYELREHPELRMPFIIRNHSGQELCDRLDRLILMLKAEGHSFITFKEFVEKVKNERVKSEK